MEDQPVARALPKRRKTQTHNKSHIHVSSGNRTHDPGVRAGEDGSCVRLGGHYDRLKGMLSQYNY
jgi:hypothetical protein